MLVRGVSTVAAIPAPARLLPSRRERKRDVAKLDRFELQPYLVNRERHALLLQANHVTSDGGVRRDRKPFAVLHRAYYSGLDGIADFEASRSRFESRVTSSKAPGGSPVFTGRARSAPPT